jgi:diguanylate cyclase (GGDEF)-like protein
VTTPSDSRTHEERLNTVEDLTRWVDTHLLAPGDQKDVLKRAIVDLVEAQRDRGQRAKLEAIEALSSGFTRKVRQLHSEIEAKEHTVSMLASYFEDVVRDLSEKARRDPKTQLMNFLAFEEYVETFLATEQRGFWCALGIVDVTDFKWVNDTLGHATGDVVLQEIARLLAEQTRSSDRVGVDSRPADFHARFGGDEFAFLLTSLRDPASATRVADRFRRAVAAFDWTKVDARFESHPVRVDVGVVCLELASTAERRGISSALVKQLLRAADELMYVAKGDSRQRVHASTVRIKDGALEEI